MSLAPKLLAANNLAPHQDALSLLAANNSCSWLREDRLQKCLDRWIKECLFEFQERGVRGLIPLHDLDEHVRQIMQGIRHC